MFNFLRMTKILAGAGLALMVTTFEAQAFSCSSHRSGCVRLAKSFPQFRAYCTRGGGHISVTSEGTKCTYPNGTSLTCRRNPTKLGGGLVCIRRYPTPPPQMPPRPQRPQNPRPSHEGGQVGNGGESVNPDTRPPSAGGVGAGGAAGSVDGNTGNGGIN